MSSNTNDPRVPGSHTCLASCCKSLDHIAIAVGDTEEALKVWRDRLGFPVLFQQRVNGDTILLTHIDLGNTHLQLVEPLLADHPLQTWLRDNGPGLHHLCFAVEDIDAVTPTVTPHGMSAKPHEGTRGQRALFLDRMTTHGVQVEVTGR